MNEESYELFCQTVVEIIKHNIEIPLLKVSTKTKRTTPYITYCSVPVHGYVSIHWMQGSMIASVYNEYDNYSVIGYKNGFIVHGICEFKTLNDEFVNAVVNIVTEGISHSITHQCLLKNSSKYRRKHYDIT